MAYFVITRTYFDDESVRDSVLEISKVSSEIFKKQPGLIEMKSLLSENKTHLSTYLVWSDQKSHLRCMESKDFAATTAEWTSLIEKGQIRFELETYQQIE